ncbi:MAG: bifunctional nuclease family protein [Candidatus Kapaibacterium sp.]
MNYNDLIKVELAGIPVSSAISGGGYALLLKEVEGERRIPIIIGHFEAQAIAFELEGLKPPRPLTHDLIKNLLDVLSYSIESVIINELRDSTFFAKLVLDSEEIDPLDSRPSDAIALALKFNAPIYVAKDVMDEIGFVPKINIDNDDLDLNDMDSDGLSDDDENIADIGNKDYKTATKEEKLKKLQHDLENAVNDEDYERAAELRDQIKKIEISNLN